MNERIQPQALQAGSSAQKADCTDAFARAAARLRAKRPLRSVRLRQIASSLRIKAPELAEQELREYLVKFPDDPDALWLLAQVIMHVRRLREAVPLLTRCLELAPDLAVARFNY